VTNVSSLQSDLSRDSSRANSPQPQDEESINNQATHILDIFMETYEPEDALTKFESLPSTSHVRFVVSALVHAVESNDVKKVEKFMSLINMCIRLGLSKDDIISGITDIMNSVSDLMIDAPKAPHLVGVALGNLVVQKASDLFRVIATLRSIAHESFLSQILKTILETVRSEDSNLYPSLLTSDVKQSVESVLAESLLSSTDRNNLIKEFGLSA